MTGAQAQLEVARANLAAHLAAQQDIVAAQATSMNEPAVRRRWPPLPCTDSGRRGVWYRDRRHRGQPGRGEHQQPSARVVGNWIWSNNGEKLSVSYSGTLRVHRRRHGHPRDLGGRLPEDFGSGVAWPALRRDPRARRELERRYYVNGSERPFEPDGRQWLHDNLPKFVRNTGIGADRRVARFLKSGGRPAVMAEIAAVDGSYVKRHLLRRAVQAGDAQRRTVSAGDGAGVARDQVGLRAGDAADLDRGSPAERRAVARRVFRGRRRHPVRLRAAPRLFDDAEDADR